MLRKQLPLPPRSSLGLVALAVVALIVCFISWAMSEAYATITLAQAGHLSQSAVHARRLYPLSNTISTLTLQQFSSLEAGRLGLKAILEANLLKDIVLEQIAGSPSDEPAAENNPATVGSDLLDTVTLLQQQMQKSHVLHIIPQHSKLVFQLETVTSLSGVVDSLLGDSHQVLILLQNTHEIRPSGGFMGSFAHLKVAQGQIENLEIQDIYQPDGQITVVLKPPAGVEEYLSGGKGWRIPDANWNPEFSQAAKDVLTLFSHGGRAEIDTVVAVNLTVIENLLRSTGPLFLPDYQLTVDHTNLASVARADRAEFFPGSQQKPLFLNSLYTHLKLKLTSLTPTQQKAVFSSLLASLQSKDIQIYSVEPEFQKFISKYQIGGILPSKPFLYLVEANVGINKANAGIAREVTIDLKDTLQSLTIHFSNSNTSEGKGQTNPDLAAAPHLHYVNYQRILLPPEVKVIRVTQDGQALPWTVTGFTTESGTVVQEVAFLVTVLEQKSSDIQLTLSGATLLESSMIIKQSGLPPTPYTIHTDKQTYSFLLEKDTMIQ